MSNPRPLPHRSRRFGIGKEIGGAVYVHRQYVDVLPGRVSEAAVFLPPEFVFTVVKLNLKTDAVTFTECEDFDLSDEPVAGTSIRISPDDVATRRAPPEDPWIYHHKWLMVSDNYTGFDVEASKERSRKWLQLDDIDMRRIGKMSYWHTSVVPRLQSDAEEYDADIS